METNKFVAGALLLSVAGLISKILSAGYRIPLQNLTGDIGFYIYQQVYPIIGIAMALALYGFPTAISKLAAEKDRISFKYFMLPILFILFLICGTFSFLLFVNADAIATKIGDKQLVFAYQLASMVFLIVPFTALLRGIFQGKSFMKPTAYSQIGEQVVRVFVIIMVAVMVSYGGWDLYRLGPAAGIASIGGSIFALCILIYFYIKDRPSSFVTYTIPWKEYGRTIIVFGLIASLNHMILLILQFADAFTMVPSLIEYGLSPTEAMEAKGVFDRGQPLIQIGAVLGSSFGLALVPAISRKGTINKHRETSAQISGALKISFILAAGASIGLIMLFPKVNSLLFQDNQGTLSLSILMVAVVLSALVITASSVLQGLDNEIWVALFILSAFLIKWLFNIFLVPHYGIIGSAIATVLSLLFLIVALVFRLKRIMGGEKLIQMKWIGFVLAISGMVIVVWLAELLIGTYDLSRFGLLIYILIVSTVGAITYLSLLVRFNVFLDSELSLLPFGSRLIRHHRRM
ncbi:putative polysaccharide biosynthesis protein [Ornithinibacillus bavariensis]|uniref:putative polysaccharide biosynthesis protein n=1 Tax=Ornithinibacillus bavariensis TaxID=545502 RepID=UPI003D1F6A10